MKPAVLAILLLWQASPRIAPEPQHFRYQRAIAVPAGATGTVCATLDGALYAHSPTLSDIRLYAGQKELPYAQLTSEAASIASDSARILNLGERSGHIVFDLAMPARPYSTVNLGLNGENFIATAKVTGIGEKPCCSAATGLGTFTLFDLTAQHLGRSTSLPLVESTFPTLHIDLTVTPAPGHPGFIPAPSMVAGATIPPSREAQTLYTTVARGTDIRQSGQQTLIAVDLPAHIPVERISFDLDPADKINFSRSVSINAQAGKQLVVEQLSGEISRVKLTTAGKEIHQESLSIPATLGSNTRNSAHVTIAIENGDDRPIPLRAVRLEMRQRELCFEAPTTPVTMFYGDDALRSPVYDYARLFQPGAPSTPAQLQPEQPNPLFIPRAAHRAFAERHPAILWLALLAVVAILAAIAFRSAKTVR